MGNFSRSMSKSWKHYSDDSCLAWRLATYINLRCPNMKGLSQGEWNEASEKPCEMIVPTMFAQNIVKMYLKELGLCHTNVRLQTICKKNTFGRGGPRRDREKSQPLRLGLNFTQCHVSFCPLDFLLANWLSPANFYSVEICWNCIVETPYMPYTISTSHFLLPALHQHRNLLSSKLNQDLASSPRL